MGSNSRRQHAQDLPGAPARTAAAKYDGLGLEHADVVLGKQLADQRHTVRKTEIAGSQRRGKVAEPVPVIVGQPVLPGHLLQQDAAAQGCIAHESDMAWHLHGSGEVVLEAVGQGCSLDLDDPLVGALTGIDRNGAMGVLHKIAETLRGRFLVDTRHAAQLEIARALHHQHAQPAAALDLQGDNAIELQAVRNQTRRGGRVTQGLSNQLIVIVIAQHAAPGTGHLDQRTTDRQCIKNEWRYSIHDHGNQGTVTLILRPGWD
jgi:hypothetical protein